jgi:replication initiation and membrane attachment protein DnaB
MNKKEERKKQTEETEKKKGHKIPIPKWLYPKVEELAREKGISVDEFAEQVVLDFLRGCGYSVDTTHDKNGRLNQLAAFKD